MGAKLAIPTDFGVGGKGVVPATGGDKDLPELLREVQTVLNATPAKWIKDAADAAAGTATAETAVHVVKATSKVTGVSFIPSAALVADATNLATLSVFRRRAGVQVAIATLVTDLAGGSWVAWIEKALALGTAANLLLLSGDVISFSITKGGTGVVVPAGTLFLDIETQ